MLFRWTMGVFIVMACLSHLVIMLFYCVFFMVAIISEKFTSVVSKYIKP
jgi:hypothetical protein